MNAALDELAESQQAYFAAGHARDLEARRGSLRRLAAALERRSEEALAALAEDLGKPALEAWLAELHFVRSEIDLAVRHLPRWAQPRRYGSPFYFLPARSEVRHEPQGRVLIAGPWNNPLLLALSPVIAAVGAGNCVTLKPSEQAPASSRFLASLLGEVFEPGHVAVVEGGAETGAALIAQPFDHYFYTGGEAVGRRYAEHVPSFQLVE